MIVPTSIADLFGLQIQAHLAAGGTLAEVDTLLSDMLDVAGAMFGWKAGVS